MAQVCRFEDVLKAAIREHVGYLRLCDAVEDAVLVPAPWRRFLRADELLMGGALRWAFSNCDLWGDGGFLAGRCREPTRLGASSLKVAIRRHMDGVECIINIGAVTTR